MTAEELVSIIGEDATMLFLSRQAGQRFAVPKNVSPRIIDHMGREAATKFVREYGGCHVFVPVAKPWRAKKLYAGGMSINQISLALCMTAKGVRHIVRENALGTDSQRYEVA